MDTPMGINCYNMNDMRQTACIVVCLIMDDNSALELHDGECGMRLNDSFFNNLLQTVDAWQLLPVIGSIVGF